MKQKNKNMKNFNIKIQKPGENLKKQSQLAFRIAAMSSEDWNLTDEITEMVGNRIIDNAGVAVAALNREAVKIARAQAMQFENKNGATSLVLWIIKNMIVSGLLGLMQLRLES